MIRDPFREQVHVRIPVGPSPFVPSGPHHPRAGRNLSGTFGGSGYGLFLGLDTHEIHARQRGAELHDVGVGVDQTGQDGGSVKIEDLRVAALKCPGFFSAPHEDDLTVADGDGFCIRVPTLG
jgi:hypothetical protein